MSQGQGNSASAQAHLCDTRLSLQPLSTCSQHCAISVPEGFLLKVSKCPGAKELEEMEAEVRVEGTATDRSNCVGGCVHQVWETFKGRIPEMSLVYLYCYMKLKKIFTPHPLPLQNPNT